MVKDRVLLIVCLMLILVGFILGASKDLFTNIKITDWLTSFGTVGAVVAALWSVNENHRLDTYKLKVTATVQSNPKFFSYGSRGSIKESNVPKVTIRVVNVGKRPITIEKICTRDKGGFYNYRPIRVKLSDNQLSFPNIEPGNFKEFELSTSEAGENLDIVNSNEYFVVDALEKHHKAQIILDSKTIHIVEPT